MLSDTSTTIDIGLTLLFLGFALAVMSWRVWKRAGIEAEQFERALDLEQAMNEIHATAAEAWSRSGQREWEA